MKQSTLTYHPMTEDEKYIIYDWKYSDEYALYNNPPYEVDLEKKQGFAHPNFMGYTFYDGDRLIGFTSLYPEENAVMAGIGVAPEHCDKGYGKLMLRITCRLSKKQFPGKQLYLEVRTWNQRAIQCYNRAGFSIDGEPFTQTTGLGEGEFYRMVKR